MSHFLFRILRIAVTVLALLAPGAIQASAAEFNEAQKSEIEQIIGDYLKANPEFIRNYLHANPEILLEVSEILRTRQREQEREAQAMALAAHKDRIENHPMTPVSGNPEGDVTLVEFFDYNCPYCRAVLPTVSELMKEDRNLRVAWKEYPILSNRSPASLTAAKVAMAAAKQGKYMEAHEALMSSPGGLKSDKAVFDIVGGLGLDMERIRADMNDPAISEYLRETMEMGDALQLTGTPSFYIDGAIVGGAVPKRYLAAVIAAARKGDLEPGILGEEDLARILQQHGS